MADEPNVTEGQSPKSEAQTPPSPQGGESDAWFEEAKQHGFKTPKDVYVSWQEATKKISLDGEELKKAKSFQADVEPILQTIWNDPELLETVKGKLNGTEVPKKDIKKEVDKATPPPTVDTETRGVLQAQIVNDFENTVGINRLDDDSKKAARKAIGQAMSRWVTPGQPLPVNGLREMLDDALILASKKDKQLMTLLSDVGQTDAEGQMSSTPSGGSKSDDIRLTPEQQKVASHFPGGEEAYKKGLKKLIKK
jgi:hypothetical protein